MLETLGRFETLKHLKRSNSLGNKNFDSVFDVIYKHKFASRYVYPRSICLYEKMPRLTSKLQKDENTLFS